ncbi:uncharacterized protein B0H64DRAFT_128136 [Chaetomium fimeti]|uniref:Uncharacterized protein n=1 Tax=Chaetomium fimeti TaxID=1854472 RepID=A0AAE0LU53_9PEZI|nr:hypothetical protein B0H64DRAFT_128136 [Chaetomium fimeti]
MTRAWLAVPLSYQLSVLRWRRRHAHCIELHVQYIPCLCMYDVCMYVHVPSFHHNVNDGLSPHSPCTLASEAFSCFGTLFQPRTGSCNYCIDRAERNVVSDSSHEER